MLKKWMIKAVVQKMISLLPFKHRINFLFQKHITKGVRLRDEYFIDKLIHHQEHEQAYQQQALHSLEGISVLEIGTGWYPVVPIAQFLCGADQIYSVDISPLMNKERIETTIGFYIQYDKEERLSAYLPNILPERMAVIHQLFNTPAATLKEYLQTLRLNYLVTDARALPLEDKTIDFITSNNTFEHIYPDILNGILKEFQRVLHPDGFMSHFIDMSDHFAHLDQTINIYNFLRFTERQWNLIDNSIQPQNRMRINQYRALYEGLNIPILSEKHRPGSLEEVLDIPLKPPFSTMPKETVAISHSYLVSGNK